MRFKPEANVAGKTWGWVWKVSSKAEFLASESVGWDIFWIDCFESRLSLILPFCPLKADLRQWVPSSQIPTTQQGDRSALRPLEDISDAFGSQQVSLISWFLVSNLLFHIRVPAACVWILIRVLALGRSQQAAVVSYKLASSTVSSVHWELYLLHTSSSQSAPCWQSKTLKAFNKLRCWEALLHLLGRVEGTAHGPQCSYVPQYKESIWVNTSIESEYSLFVGKRWHSGWSRLFWKFGLEWCREENSPYVYVVFRAQIGLYLFLTLSATPLKMSWHTTELMAVPQNDTSRLIVSCRHSSFHLPEHRHWFSRRRPTGPLEEMIFPFFYLMYAV